MRALEGNEAGTSASPVIAVSFAPSDADRQAICAPIHAYNAERAGDPRYAPLALLLRDKSGGATIGGLWGDFYYEWLFVAALIVPPPLRGMKIGSRLLANAERIARERGSVGVWLDSFTFQAPEFYRKQGYEVFGTLSDYPKGVERVFLRKIFAAGA